jgi:hypothetical protein
MTLDEAEKLAIIAEGVHGECEECCEAVVAQLNGAFADFYWERKGKLGIVCVREHTMVTHSNSERRRT